MSLQGKLKQYLLIVEMLKQQPNQMITDINNMLYNRGFDLSERTLQRNFEALRNEFGVDVKCDRSFNTYSINSHNSINIDVFIKFLHSALHAQFVSDNIKDFKDISQFIHLAGTTSISGLEHLEPLLNAIKTKRVITFTHENYTYLSKKQYSIEPYLLKEYLNRWYIIGYVPDIKDFRTFGVDRLANLKTTNNKFKRKANIDPRDFFENTIGLVYSEHSLQKVTIEATMSQAKYLRSQPLHSSQTENPENIFTLTLTPNYELTQRILMMGSEIRVTKPQWLQDEVVKILKDTLGRYN